MTSAFIENQRAAAAVPSTLESELSAALKAVEMLSDRELPSVKMMNIIGSHDRHHFVASMRGFFQEFVYRAKLTPVSNILDIGSGCGRLALPFSHYVVEGRYWGVDVWDEGVRWCRDNISRRNPRFRFETMVAENNYYQEAYDPLKVNTYQMPFIPSASLDFAFAISVFTHILEQDAVQYFVELRRCMKPDGIAYLTGFIIDQHFFKYVERTQQHTAVQEVNPGVWQAYSGQDFFAGYAYDKWEAMLTKSGLRIVSYEVGTWAEKPGARMYQDTFIVIRVD